ncbi:hypothetical protein VNO80_15925 [Phaseolus coccineus]|uniref:Uncharacterized protein n=1 Tax=Phaseolus coccineus TaxID=3886 RepID=A0AAN9ML71_PHACN
MTFPSGLDTPRPFPIVVNMLICQFLKLIFKRMTQGLLHRTTISMRRDSNNREQTRSSKSFVATTVLCRICHEFQAQDTDSNCYGNACAEHYQAVYREGNQKE